MLMKTATLLTALSALGLPPSVAGWWDEGHMLSTAIAKSLLSEETVQKYENVLKCADNQGEWANFTDLVRASVWMKHVRCTSSETGDFCAGIDPKHRQGLRLMDDWGADETPWKPPPPDAPYVQTNVTLPIQYNTFAQDVIGKVVSSFMEKPTSAWSLAFHLRVFLNVFTNLHQRLNTGSYYDENFPNGRGQYDLTCLDQDDDRDYPGKCASIPGVRTFYDLYESGCGSLNTSWSSLVKDNNDYVTKEAANISGGLPAEHFINHPKKRLSANWNNADKNYGFGEGLKDDFTDAIKYIADDSLATFPSVWFEYRRNASRDTTYAPSWWKISIGKTSAKNQTALAGYRLASWLNALAQYIPDEALCDLSEPDDSKPDDAKDYQAIIWAYRWGVLATAAVCLVVGGGVGWFCARQANKNNDLEASLASPQTQDS